MAIEESTPRNLKILNANRIYAAVLVIIVLAALTWTLAIPFNYPSASIGYKLGINKHLLRAGKMCGLIAMLLLLLQLPLAGRIKCLDRIFGLAALYRMHRWSAYLLCGIAIAHPVLVLVPDDMLMIPWEARYWPEWIGALLLLAILTQVVLTQWRRSFLRTYERWLLCHRSLGICILILVVVHVLYVSDTFETGDLPRWAVMSAAAGSAMLWGWVRFQAGRLPKSQFKVHQIEKIAPDAHRIELTPATSQRFAYLPGQFVFASFEAANISPQVHPFTLSSSPTRPKYLQMTIRSCGDWTMEIGKLKVGDTAHLQGPFGRFSHLVAPTDSELIMIAGGIGITPMIGMLRCMNDHNDRRPITLIWSNRSKQHLFYESELVGMTQQLTSFQWIPIFTRETDADVKSGRLDRQMLEDLLKHCSRSAIVFLCGPPRMIASVRTQLRHIGFSTSVIKHEAFSL